MAESNTVEDAIKDLATAPRSFEADGQRIQEHDPRALIEVDKYLEAKAKAKAGGSGIRVQQTSANRLW